MSTLHFTRRDIVAGETKAINLILNLNQHALKPSHDVHSRYLDIINQINHIHSAPCIVLSMEVDRPISNWLIYVPVDREYKNPSQVAAGCFSIVVLNAEGDDISLHCGNMTEDRVFQANFTLTSLRKYAAQDPDTWIDFNAVLKQLLYAHLTKIEADQDIFVRFEQMSKRVDDYLNQFKARHNNHPMK